MRRTSLTACLLPIAFILAACGSSAGQQGGPSSAPSPTKLRTQDGAQYQICQMVPSLHAAITGTDRAAVESLNEQAWKIWTEGTWLGMRDEEAFKTAFFKYRMAWKAGDADMAVQAWDEWAGMCQNLGYLPSPSP